MVFRTLNRRRVLRVFGGYKKLKRFYNIKYKKWGGLQMNLDTTQERYLFVNFHGLRVTFHTSHICIALAATADLLQIII